MTPREKYGNEYTTYETTIPVRGTKQKRPARGFAVGIRPEPDMNATLEKAWSILRELAGWLSAGDEMDDDEECEVSVRWSPGVRPRQERIFRACGNRRYFDRLTRDPKFAVPPPVGWFGLSVRWDRDVWGAEASEQEVQNRRAELHARKRRIRAGLEENLYPTRDEHPED